MSQLFRIFAQLSFYLSWRTSGKIAAIGLCALSTLTLFAGAAQAQGVTLPELTLTKAADDNTDRALGHTITYTYTVENTGDVNISDVTVSDQHTSSAGTSALTVSGEAGDAGNSGGSTDAAVNGSWDVLAPGDTVTFTATYVVTTNDAIAGADITNTATATGTPDSGTLTDPTASETVTLYTPSLYPVTSQAIGACTVDTVVFGETFDDGTNAGFYAVSQTSNAPIGLLELTNNLGNINNTITDPTIHPDLNGGAGGPSPSGGGFAAAFDAIGGEPTWTLAMGGQDWSALLNGGISYEFWNYYPNKSVTSYNDQVLYYQIISSSGKLVLDLDISNYVADLLAGEWVTIEALFDVSEPWFYTTNTNPRSESGLVPATATDFANVLADVQFLSIGPESGGGGNYSPPGNDQLLNIERYGIDTIQAFTCVPTGSPELTLTKVADDDTDVVAGQTITYTYTIENTGDVNISDVTVSDQHTSSAGTAALTVAGEGGDAGNSAGSTDAAVNGSWDVLAPGDTVTFTATYVVTTNDAIAGTDITNTATATGTPDSGTLTDPTASETVTVEQLVVNQVNDVSNGQECLDFGGTLVGPNIFTAADNGTFGTGSGAADEFLSTNIYAPQVSGGTYRNSYATYSHGSFSFVSNQVDRRNPGQFNGTQIDPVYGPSGIFMVSDPSDQSPTLDQQLVGLTPGIAYEISFWVADTEHGNGSKQRMAVDIDGTQVFITPFINSNGNGDANKPVVWQKYSYVYVHNSASTTAIASVRFNETGAAGRDVFLDNIEMRTCSLPTDLVTVKALSAGSSATPGVGDTVSYDITVTNNGTGAATGVTLTDLLPAGLTIAAGHGTITGDANSTGGSYDQATGLWSIGSIALNETVTLTLVGTVDAGQVGQTIENVIANPASGNENDPSTVGDDLTESVIVATTPELDTAKSASVGALQADGTVDVTYTVVVENTGNVSLSPLTLMDDLTASDQLGSAFNGIVTAPAVTLTNTSTSSTAPTTNGAGYDGTNGLITGSDGTLAPGDLYSVVFTVNVDPNAAGAPATLDNTATAGGTPPSGPAISDDSDTDTAADGSADGTANAPGGPGDPTIITPPAEVGTIGLVKSSSVNDGGDGSVDAGDTITYSYVVTNTSSIVNVYNVSVSEPDDASNAFTGTGTVPSPVYASGGSDLDGGAGTATDIAPGQTVSFTAVYTLTQDDIDAGKVDNSAVAAGTDPAGNALADTSDSANPADGDGSGTPGSGGTDDEITSTPFGPLPELDTAKSASVGALQADGTVDVTYTVVVENTGNVSLSPLTLMDDLTASDQLGSAFNGIVTAPAVTLTNTSTSSTAPTTNGAGYDGTNGLITGSDGTLAPGDLYSVVFTVNVDPNAAGAPATLDNTATAGGTPPSGPAISDDSDTDTAADGSADGTANAPGGPGDPTIITPPSEVGTIGLVKSSSVNDGGDGSVDAGDTITYSYVVTNTSSIVNVYNVSVSEPDDASNAFTGTGTVPSPVYASGGSDLDGGAGTATDIAPGQTVSFTAVYTLTQDDIDAGKVDNSAVAAGTDPAGNALADTSDSANPADGDGSGTPGSGGTDDEITSTPFGPLPELDTAKSASVGTLQADGTVDVTYTVVVENTGNVSLSPLTLMDDLTASDQLGSAFNGIVTAPAVTLTNTSTSSTAPTTNGAGYDGTNGLITGSDGTLAPGDLYSVVFTVNVDPNAAGAPATLDNTATAGGTPPSGPAISDDSDTDTAADGSADGTANAPGGPGDPTIITPPSEVGTIGLVKSSSVNDGGDGSVDAGDTITYSYVVTNTSSIVNVYNVSVSEPDDASNAFTGTGTVPSPVYASGGSDLDGGAGTATDIAPGQTVSFTAVYTLTQDDIDAGKVDNSAVAAGTDPAGNALADTSDSANPADGDGSGTPGSGGTDDEITSTPFGPLPELDTAKSASVGALQADGTVDVTYTVVVENTGNVSLSPLTLMDDLTASDQLGSAFNGIVTAPAVTLTNTSTSSTAPTTNGAGYDGTNGLITGSDGTLAPGDLYSVVFTVNVDPNAAGAPATLDNTATAGGTPPSGPAISDDSDTDTAADGSADGTANAPGGPGDPTIITPPSEVGTIGLVKSSSVNDGGDGSVDAGDTITYSYVVTNTSSIVNVYNVSVSEPDDASNAFTGTGTVPSPVYASGGSDLDGGAGTATDIAPGQTVSFTAVYTLTQDDIDAGKVDNSAVAAGTDPAGNALADTSDSANPADGDGSGTPGSGGTDDEITSTPFGPLPELDTAKSASVGALQADGTVDVTYTVVVENTGNVSLSPLTLMDDLTASDQLGSAFNGIVTAPAVTLTNTSTSSTAPTTNGAGYDGTNGLITGSDGTLAPGDLYSVVFTVNVDPNAAGAPATLDNTATAGGTPPSGPAISDDSDTDTAADGSADGTANAPGGPGDPTIITPPAEVGTIGLVKSSSVNDGGDGSVDAGDTITYSYVVTNTSSIVNVYNVSVSEPDDASNAFTGTGTVPSPVYASGGSDLDGGAGTATDIAPGQTVSFTAVYTLTQDDIDAGKVDNSAVAAGTDPAGNALADTSDSANPADGDGSGTPGSGGTDDEITSTPFGPLPELDTAKSASVGALQADGTVDVTYTVVVENTGNVSLSPLTLMDDLTASDQLGSAFNGIVTAPAVTLTNTSTSSTAPTTNGAGYDGTNGLITGSDGTLAPGDLYSVVFTVNVDPNAAGAPATLDNTATAGGTPPSGPAISDDSDTDTAADGSADGTANVPGGPGDPTIITPPAEVGTIGLVKSSSVNDGGDGSVDAGDTITYSYVVTNTSSIVNVYNVSVSEPDDASNAFTGTGTVPSPVYASGGSDLDGGAGTATDIAPGQTVSFTAVYTLTQDDIDAGKVDNSAVAAGTDPAGNALADTSDSANPADGDGSGTPGSGGTDDEITSTPFGPLPELDTAKSASVGALQADGTVDVTYTVVVENTGNVSLSPLTLIDDLTASDQLGSAFNGIVTAPAVTLTNTSTSSTAPTTNGAGYDGTNGLITGSDGTLAPGDLYSVVFTVNVDPNAAGAPATLDNTATAGGTPPSGPAISDDSDTDTAADGSADGTANVPGGPGDPTIITPPAMSPELNTGKGAVVGALQADGTFDVTYTIAVENTGDVILDALTLADDLTAADQLGSAFNGVVAAPVVSAGSSFTAGSSLPTTNGAGYDGTNGLLIGTDGTLVPGDVYSVVFTVNVDPNAAGAPAALDNTATAGGSDPSGAPVSDDSDADTAADGSADGTANVPGGPGDPTIITPPAMSPSIALVKAASLDDGGDGTVDAGDTVTYTYSVTNTGDVNLEDIAVTENAADFTGTGILPVPSYVSGGSDLDGEADAADLAVGAGVIEFTATYTLTLEDVDVGFVDNRAGAEATDPSGAPVADLSDESAPGSGAGNDDPTRVPLPSAPSLVLLKSAPVNADEDESASVTFGDTLTYTVTATNEGNITLTNVVVSDGMLTPTSESCAAVAPGETCVLTGSYQVALADVAAAEIVNTASALSDQTPDPVSDAVTTPVVQQPLLAIEKTLAAETKLFPYVSEITFRITMENAGDTPLTGVQLEDDIATAMAPSVMIGTPVVAVSGFGADNTADPSYDGIAQLNTLSGLGELAVGQMGTVDITVQLDFTDGYPGAPNTAYGTSDQTTDPVASDFPVDTPDNPNDTNPTPVVIVDADGDGAPDDLESSTEDRDGDGISDADDYDPTGYFYCEEDGSILTGGLISVINLATGGVQSGLGTSNNITVHRDGSDGYYQFTVNAAGKYRLVPTYPPVATVSTDRTANTAALDMTSFLPTDPAVIGAGEIGATGQLSDYSAAANPFWFDFDIEAGDPNVFNNNLPMKFCGTPSLAATKTVESGPDLQGDGAQRIIYRVGAISDGTTIVEQVQLVDDLAAAFPGASVAVVSNVIDAAPASFGGAVNPAFDGITDTNMLDGNGSLEVGESVELLLTVDVVIASGGDFNNIVEAQGVRPGSAIGFGGTPVAPASADAEVALAPVGDLVMTKSVDRSSVRIGEAVLWTVTAESPLGARPDISIVDTLPVGFVYVPGSAQIDGIAAEPVVSGRSLTWAGQTVGVDPVIVTLVTRVGAGTSGIDTFTNTVHATDSNGEMISNVATASVRYEIEPLFDCGEIIGKVFDDKNRNGYQDEGEPGLAGVRMATVRGLNVISDAYGRYHVTCAQIPDADRGSNFLLKLDARTLPSGYRITTENPRVVRLTRGKITKLNFGASVSRVIALNLTQAAFVEGSDQMIPDSYEALDDLVEALNDEPSVLRLTYYHDGTDTKELIRSRLSTVATGVQDRWNDRDGRYRLEVELRIMRPKQ